MGIPPPSRAGPTDGLRSPLPPSACTGLTPTQPCSSFPPPLTQLTPSRCHHHGQHGQESARGAAGPPAAPRHPPAAPHNGRRGREGALTAPPSPRLHPRARTALPALFHPLRAEGGKGEVSPPGSLAPSPLPRPHPVLLILFSKSILPPLQHSTKIFKQYFVVGRFGGFFCFLAFRPLRRLAAKDGPGHPLRARCHTSAPHRSSTVRSELCF